MTRSSRSSGSCPWAMPSRTPGTMSRTRAAVASMVSMRLCTKKTCPPRCSSRRIASASVSSLNWQSSVWIGSRSRGGVLITDMSRAPMSAR